ncbi:glycosyltransferase family 4 protein [Oharaeibacter diazotrophicus]|uniref:Phosphatidylinositol alpha-1,6-mannosyltransferase n=2 Tax=Oharaeibacter diazotrophicus TaxID=1920512 RepID=A0A4R6R8F6_9HYPH|nr:glycosyltransferase family 4 protein [Oharaeibacter diazotrophicus]TDP82310.1 phosphatidylinositol alpha-1,6-mannosyltransferase [Oharaeibacter diazotrophicus]BBE72927.1 GDP-mannose-dependent alpha-(1-6)-phosphatidylinositol monomannoside mannosyltransferase [Pleomorphomonas sp. SM30]GLS76965.1 hypothetical protein GCM10007904_23020 [Oharaeibacter diazotrophicus]
MSTPRALVAAQYLAPGAGGIAVVARLTAKVLGRIGPARGLSCMETGAFRVHDVPVRGCAGSRLGFVARLAVAAARADHVYHDFAGTLRARPFAALGGAGHAAWAHGEEIWDRPRPDYADALARADLVLVNSGYTLERAAASLGRCRRVALCRLATEEDEAPDAVGPADAPPTVLLLGRIDDGLPKGHDLLISIWPRVAAAVPGARLVLAGGGVGVAAVRALAAASPAAASIEVTGFVPAADVEALWRRTRVLAMPSRGEGFGLVFIEAMRRGLPVLSSTEDAGGDLVADGVTGFARSRARPDAVVDALVDLLRDGDLARRFGAAGHHRWHERHRYGVFERDFLAATADFRGA